MDSKDRILKLLRMTCIAIALVIPCIVLFGWFDASPRLVLIGSSVTPMSPNGAIGFVVFGLCLIFRESGRSSKYLSPLVLGVVGIAILTLCDRFSLSSFGIDHLFISSFALGISTVGHPGSMSVNTASALTLLGLALLRQAFAKRESSTTYIVILALGGTTVGIVALLGYFFGIERASGWSHFASMAPATAVCSILVGGTVALGTLEQVTDSERRTTMWVLIYTTLCGFVATTLLWASAVQEQTEIIRSQFTFDSQSRVRLIEQSLTGEINLLRSIERFFANSDDVTRSEFAHFVIPLLTDGSVSRMYGVDWSPRVPAEERSTFVDRVRSEGIADFHIKQLDTSEKLQEREISDVYYPVLFSEPVTQNKLALGFDHYSDPIRKLAMERAIAEHTPIATRPITLFRAHNLGGTPSDFLVVVPVYEPTADTSRQAVSAPNAKGFIFGVLRFSSIIEGALHNLAPLPISIEVRDENADQRSEPMITYPPATAQKSNRSRSNGEFTSTYLIQKAGRTWSVVCTASEQYVAQIQSWYPNLILLSGLFITLMVAGYTSLLRGQTKRERKLVDELKDEAARQSEIIASQQDIVASGRSIDVLMDAITKRTQAATNAEGAVVEMVDGEQMFYRAVSGSVSAFKGMRINRTGSLAGLCVAENQPLRCDDAELDPRVDKVACRNVGIRSLLVVPLRHAGEVIGVVKVVSSKPDAFSERDGGRLYMLSAIISAAISDAATAQALADKNGILERSTAFKSQFLANMSHEIRTPLTSIIGFSESLLSDVLEKEERLSALETILRNGRHLLQIINDILDFSKIEAGKLDVEAMPISLFELLSDVGNVMQHKAEEAGISFNLDYNFPLPRIIRSDPTRLKQILLNLVGNAIKFTKSGGVKIVVSCYPEKQTISFAIVDTGVGLSEEQIGRLFQAFSQADASTTRKFGGTGLGLEISQQLATRLGGGITVSSVPGQGSTFTATVLTGPLSEDVICEESPLSRASKPLLLAPISTGQFSGKVLLAEDGPDNQKFITFILRRANIDFKLVENGAAALAAVENETFDLVLMDMQMPVMDGFSATREIRERGINVPIVALTANTMTQDVERCLAAGCTDFVGKPFERAVFFAMLKRHLKATERIDESSTSSEPIVSDLSDPDFQPLVKGFVDSLSLRRSELQTAADIGDQRSVMLLAHRLRGSAHMFGYPMLGKSAGQLEDALTSGMDFDWRSKVAELCSLFDRITVGSTMQTTTENSETEAGI